MFCVLLRDADQATSNPVILRSRSLFPLSPRPHLVSISIYISLSVPLILSPRLCVSLPLFSAPAPWLTRSKWRRTAKPLCSSSPSWSMRSGPVEGRRGESGRASRTGGRAKNQTRHSVEHHRLPDSFCPGMKGSRPEADSSGNPSPPPLCGGQITWHVACPAPHSHSLSPHIR